MEQLKIFSGMERRFLNRTFANFTETADNQRALQHAKRYAEKFDEMMPNGGNPPRIEKNGLLLTGSYGTGKTHLAASIANELMARGKTVICMTMIDMLGKIKSSFERRELHEDEIMDKYKQVQLLIIDDLGSEQPSEWGICKIYTIVNARYEAYMPTIFTTNYGGTELINRMTPPKGGDPRNAEKTVDRINEMCGCFAISGRSWRR